MSKFERVLSDACCMDILAKIDGFSATSDGEVYVGSGDDVWFQLAEFAEQVEKATIAALKKRLAEQEPVAWFIDDKRACGNRIITDLAIAKDWLEANPDKVTPLYAHPIPAIEQEPVAWKVHPFDYGVGVEGAYALTQQKDQIQAWIRKGWDVTPLYTHPIPETKEHHRAAKNHIPDAKKAIAPESERRRADSIALEYRLFSDWCRANPSFDLDSRLHSHGGTIDNGGYISDEKTRIAFAAWRASKKALEAAPKYTGDSNE